MSLKLRKDQPVVSASSSVQRQPAQTIEGWLSMLAGMLPGAQAQGIRDELETHLRDRVHDLMVGGMKETDAMRVAIAELGEAADLAAKYRALQNEPRRRLLMYGSVLGVAGAALAVSVTSLIAGSAMKPAQPPQPANAVQTQAALDRVESLRKQNDDLAAAVSRLEVEHNQLAAERQVAAERTRTVNAAVFEPAMPGGPYAGYVNQTEFDGGVNGLNLADAFDGIAKVIGHPIEVDERALEAAGVNGDVRVNFNLTGTTFPEVMNTINSLLPPKSGAQLDYRVDDPMANAKGISTIRVSTRDAFDRREMRLVSYDLSGILAAQVPANGDDRAKAVQEVTRLILEFVSPNDWKENGGELASQSIVGDRMFINAPARMHPQIKWMLDQLAANAPVAKVPVLGDVPIVGRLFKRSDASTLHIYKLNFANASTAAEKLRGALGQEQAGLWSVSVDPRVNSIVVSGSAEQHERVRKVLRALGESDESIATDVRTFPLRIIPADSAIMLLKDVFNASPALRRNPSETLMTLDLATNSITLKAPQDKIDAADTILEMIDQAAPGAASGTASGTGATKEVMLQWVKPIMLRELLSRMFNDAPGLKKCAVERVIECNDDSGFFRLTAAKDQVDAVDRLITLMDRPDSVR